MATSTAIPCFRYRSTLEPGPQCRVEMEVSRTCPARGRILHLRVSDAAPHGLITAVYGKGLGLWERFSDTSDAINKLRLTLERELVKAWR